MSEATQRALFDDNGTLKDVSVEFNSYVSGELTMSYVAGEDYLYVGSDLPFNQKYFDLGETVNSVVSALTVELWNDGAWDAAVDVLDRTASEAGASLSRSGYISWMVDPDKGWMREAESEDVTGLEGTKIYDLYWARFSWSATMTAGVALKHLGHKFSEDEDLYGQYPDLRQQALKTAFNGGDASKTDWNEQAFIAATSIVEDLMARGVIVHGSQLLDHRRFRMASVHKTAEVIYRGLGRSEEKVSDIAKQYRTAMNMKKFWIDLNRDAKLSEAEKRSSTVFMTR